MTQHACKCSDISYEIIILKHIYMMYYDYRNSYHTKVQIVNVSTHCNRLTLFFSYFTAKLHVPNKCQVDLKVMRYSGYAWESDMATKMAGLCSSFTRES